MISKTTKDIRNALYWLQNLVGEPIVYDLIQNQPLEIEIEPSIPYYLRIIVPEKHDW